MKNRSLILFLMSFFFYESCLYAKFDIKSMLEGMGTTFGAPPVGYTYSYEVWSDASIPVYVQQQGIASFMGAFFPSAKGYYGEKKLKTIFESTGTVSKAVYKDQDYYFKFFISANSQAHKDSIYRQSLTQLPLEKHDPNVYYYHVYTGRKYEGGHSIHVPKVESMGFQNPSEKNSSDETKKGNVKFGIQLSDIAFYNSSGTDVRISLTYGTVPYSFTVEKYSYNSLAIPSPEEKEKEKSADDTVAVSDNQDEKKDKKEEAPPAFSLRPNTISFSTYNATTKKYEEFRSLLLPKEHFDGYSCTIEIFQDLGKSLEVGIQGLNTGNYDLGVTPRVRDLTPCPCVFWHKSFAQEGSVEGYRDLPGQIWVAYGGADNPVRFKVEPGKAVSWNLTRPWIAQADQFVYFMYVVTNDDAVAAKFVEKVVKQELGKNVIAEYDKATKTAIVTSKVTAVDAGLNLDEDVDLAKLSITAEQEVATLMGNLTVSDGVIEDTALGVIGYLVGTDVFTPKGLGFGRFYYSLAPSIISVSNLVSLVYGCLESSKLSGLGSSDTDIRESLAASVNDWFTLYIDKPAEAQAKVEKYLLDYGNSKVVDEKTHQLTKFGQNRVQMIISGSVSLKYPSMKLSTVTNHYVYDFGKSVPKEMPTPVANIIDQKPFIEETQKNQLKAVSVVAKK